ncbi:putative serine/threonine-protein kinase [Tetrabaena socialis]|uniref:non-specific serine/threonine protein kinase n=1 Tax=Tetrabaena socialis TaxID=47790 RepID=A0A2J7ZV61_9CHLO|nr:putative serine/threonine-protein kinase [Tetrabaena socialis]|eukprot:PNH04167.1 putative serine/threonine-protein kinase [Tetrabaena socialis]
MAHDGGELKPVETDPDCRYSRYDVVLGRGAFKTVFRAFNEDEGIEVAWNQIKVNDLVSSPAERERLFAEIRVLKQLKHKNIMTFYDSWLDNKNGTVNFITELFTSGTLRQYRKKHKQIDEQVLKRWAWQILQGLVYLHGHNPPIIHRDLKCDNIFVNGTSGVIKIGDLGLVTLCRGFTAPQSVLGTPEFMAPELYEEKYDEKVDVYSFGMCLLELATMEYPYAECKNAAQIYKKVTQGILPGGVSKVQNTELREFMELCIQHDPNQRPEARQLLKHPFFESLRAQLSCGGNEKQQEKLAAALVVLEEAAPITLSIPSTPEVVSDDEPAPPASQQPRPSSSGASNGSPLTHGGEADPYPHADAPMRAASPGLPPPARAPSPALPNGHSELPAPPHLAGVHPLGHHLFTVEGGKGGSFAIRESDSAQDLRSPSLQEVPAGSQHRQQPGASASYAAVVNGTHGAAGGSGGGAGGQDAGSEEQDAEGAEEGEQLLAVRAIDLHCKQIEDAKLSFQLRFTEPAAGHCKTVEFAFDMAEDTAECIANEMMEDLSLSAAEAQDIAAKIREAMAVAAATAAAHAAASATAAAASATAAAASAAAAAASPPPPLPPAASAPQPAAPAAAAAPGSAGLQALGSMERAPSPSLPAAPTALPSLYAASTPQPSLATSASGRVADPNPKPPLPTAASAPPAQPPVAATEARRSATGLANGRTKSGYHTPAGEEAGGGSLKGVSIHELIAAMREAQDEVAADLLPPPAVPSLNGAL